MYLQDTRPSTADSGPITKAQQAVLDAKAAVERMREVAIQEAVTAGLAQALADAEQIHAGCKLYDLPG